MSLYITVCVNDINDVNSINDVYYSNGNCVYYNNSRPYITVGVNSVYYSNSRSYTLTLPPVFDIKNILKFTVMIESNQKHLDGFTPSNVANVQRVRGNRFNSLPNSGGVLCGDFIALAGREKYESFHEKNYVSLECLLSKDASFATPKVVAISLSKFLFSLCTDRENKIFTSQILWNDTMSENEKYTLLNKQGVYLQKVGKMQFYPSSFDEAGKITYSDKLSECATYKICDAADAAVNNAEAQNS